jgi:glycosyltransferase involved in cell wall biosynthesis
MIAISRHIQADIKQWYGRESVIVYPPVDTERFNNETSAERSGFITVGRQATYKRTDLLIEACNELHLPLTVIGRGPDHARLVNIAGPTITFLTDIPDAEMPQQLASAEAFLFAAYEDFGIAPVEAMAAGTPVIAFKAGGALDYVMPGQTGEFFENQTVDSLVAVLKSFKSDKYSSNDIKEQAKKFSTEQFHKNLSQTLYSVLK